MLESEVSGFTLRIQLSLTDREENDGVKPRIESDNSERGDNVHYVMTVRNDH